MAFDVSWLNQVMPIWAFILVFIVVYAILQKTKILGANKIIDSIIGIIFGIILITFSSVRDYLINITPWFAVLLSVLFFFLLIVMFAAKEPEKMFKPITIVFVILLAIIAIIAALYTFPSTQALLPEKISGKTVSSCRASYDYFDSSDCYKKSGYWKCYTDSEHEDYETYNSCFKSGNEYKCYDEQNCNSKNENDIFGRIHSWFYREKITNAFWLILIALVVIVIVTRG